MIDLYASRPHYASHMMPVWSALAADVQGSLWGTVDGQWWARDPMPGSLRGRTVMVCGYVDLQEVRARGASRVIYVEHGAGQTYPGDPRSACDPSYSGGRDHDGVSLHICPSETVADRWRAMYRAPAVAVGCPLLDPWHRAIRPHIPEDRPTVALAFHWDCGLIPETRSAFAHYEADIGRCVALWRAQGFAVVGHGHPRIQTALGATWAALDVPAVNLGWVYDHADVLAVDNSSIAYEFASLGRDVVLMNAPWYRRDVEHGLRFWSHVPGLQVSDPDGLGEVVRALLADDHGARAASYTMRGAAVERAYDRLVDGYASWRAVRAVMEVMGDERGTSGRPGLPGRQHRGRAGAAA